MKILLTCLFAILGLFACGRVKQTSQQGVDNTNFEKKRILIRLNSTIDDVFGIPIYTRSKELRFCIKSGEELTEKDIDGRIYNFSLISDSLFVKISGNDCEGYGKFIVPKLAQIKFQTTFDPETFIPIIRPIYFFEPLKTGLWKISGDSVFINREYKFEFGSTDVINVCK